MLKRGKVSLHCVGLLSCLVRQVIYSVLSSKCFKSAQRYLDFCWSTFTEVVLQWSLTLLFTLKNVKWSTCRVVELASTVTCASTFIYWSKWTTEQKTIGVSVLNVSDHKVIATVLTMDPLLPLALPSNSPQHTGLVFCWLGPLAQDRAPTWPLPCCTTWKSCQSTAWIYPLSTPSALRRQRSLVLR